MDINGLVPWMCVVSRTCSTPEIHATVRSKPKPNPQCGTLP